jgi:hypothetical protein
MSGYGMVAWRVKARWQIESSAMSSGPRPVEDPRPRRASDAPADVALPRHRRATPERHGSLNLGRLIIRVQVEVQLYFAVNNPSTAAGATTTSGARHPRRGAIRR